MDELSIEELINIVDNKMCNLSYAPTSMEMYRVYWRDILKFAKKHQINQYSQAFADKYIKEYLKIKHFTACKDLSFTKRNKLRALRVIDNYVNIGSVTPLAVKKRKLPIDENFSEILIILLDDMKLKGFSDKTVLNTRIVLVRFLNNLTLNDISDVKKINIEIINNYCNTLSNYRKATIQNHLNGITRFMKFLYTLKLVDSDYSKQIIKPKIRNQINIPSVWTKNEVAKMLSTIERANPTGKRDYAIILLACGLGIRCSDIANLKFENLDWDKNQISFIQVKTDYPVVLPITKEVGWALIDYIKNARPQSNEEFVFLKLNAPYNAFTTHTQLSYILKKYIERSNIKSDKKKQGLHSLRHTLASMMLSTGAKLETVSNTLGHSSTSSTEVYLKVDVGKLQECFLKDSEVPFDV